MSSKKWIQTKFRGVRYYEHETRRHGIKKDRYYSIRIQKDGVRREEGLGWGSDGWTEEKAILELANIRKAQTTGEGEQSLKEKREKAKSKRIAEEEDKKRLESENFSEIIMATNPDLEGEATAAYVKDKINQKGQKIEITRIARGLPVGGDLEYADEVTLKRSLEGRKDYF